MNWLEAAETAVRGSIEDHAIPARHVTERLASLLFERLSEGADREMLLLLGGGTQFERPLPSDPSVGYMTFVERAGQAILCASHAELEEDELERMSRDAVDSFFTGLCSALPDSARRRLADELPSEISRKYLRGHC